MSVSEKVFEALRQAVLVNERIERLNRAIEKLEEGQSDLRDRVIRIEALIEYGRNQAPRLKKE